MSDLMNIGASGPQVPFHPQVEKPAVQLEAGEKADDTITLGGTPEPNSGGYSPHLLATSAVQPEKVSAGKLSATGYDENFLGEGFTVPHPQITGAAKESVLVYNESGDSIRDYTHFSLVMNRERKIAFYTAANLDGGSMVKNIKRVPWRIDETLGAANQLGGEFYKNNKLDRGHLVRRLDVVWGTNAEAKQGNADSFNYSNASPQHKDLNQGQWLLLENWLLDRAEEQNKKLCVFTGPVFRDDDVEYRGEKIPADFWKIVLLQRKTDGKVAAAGFMISQKELLDDLIKHKKGAPEFANDMVDKVDTSIIAVHQVPLATIEQLTSLDFGSLKEVDAYALYDEKKEQSASILSGPIPILDDRELTGHQAAETGPSKNRLIRSKEDIII